MSSSTSPSRTTRTRLRWAVPAVAVAAVTGAVTVSSPFAAAGPPDLPERTAAQLLAEVAGAERQPLSGTVVQTSRLGLPELPSGPGTETGPTSLLSGSHTVRIWSDGPEQARVALLGDLSEYDAVRDGRDAWTYSSQRDEAVHYVLPADTGQRERTPPPGAPTTPEEAARAALAALEPSTAVRAEENVRVAGRAAYQLVLEPRDPRTLVGSVRLALDAKNRVPLRVQVWSTQDRETPAVEVGFTDVDFARPDASVFRFSAPPGAQVREVPLDGHGAHDERAHEASGRGDGSQPTATGSGWTRVVELDGVDVSELQGEQAGLLDQLTARVPEGRLLTSALVSVLLTDDGRALAGAVPAEVLREQARTSR